MRPKKDITGNYLRLRTEFIKEYLSYGCEFPVAIRYADIDMRLAEHYGCINELLAVDALKSYALKLEGRS